METNFSRSIKTHLPADKLWSELLAGFKNSDDHPFWPTYLEESHSENFKEQGTVDVNYKFFVKGKPVTYKITELDQAKQEFAYKTTENHPLSGHAKLRVYPNNSGGSTLRWEGHYEYPWYSTSGLFMRTVFLKMFFNGLKDSIHDYEKSLENRNELNH